MTGIIPHGQHQLAEPGGIYNAFAAYKKKHSGSITVPYLPEPKSDKVEIPQVVPQNATGAKAKDKTAEKSVAPQEQLVTEAQPQQEVKEAEQPAEEAQSQVPTGVDLSVVKDDAPAARTEPAEAKQQPAEAKQQPQAPADAPVFKVQILVSKTKLKSSDARLKGQKSAAYYQEGGMYKYTLGSSTDYNEIYRLRKSILDKFPEAFIIAFKGDAKMNVQEAIREFKKNRLK